MLEVKIELLLEIFNIFPSDMHAGMYLEKKKRLQTSHKYITKLIKK